MTHQNTYISYSFFIYTCNIKELKYEENKVLELNITLPQSLYLPMKFFCWYLYYHFVGN